MAQNSTPQSNPGNSSSSQSGNPIPSGNNRLLDGIDPALWEDAEYSQFGSALIITLGEQKIIVVSNYFTDAPDLGIPPSLSLSNESQDTVFFDADSFNTLLDDTGLDFSLPDSSATIETFTPQEELTPSSSPSSTPSTSPSSTPSSTPSNTPSVSPNITPSASPSFTPSVTPSISPSFTPSSTASVTPSVSPSITPSTTASISPSSTPSFTPSTSPSVTPSSTPSTSPSISPSSTPSFTPSSTPDLLPSASPSSSPSFTPSITPSSTPSFTPSSTPSVSPSSTPSTTPQPSVTPSTTPSATPSISPSTTPSTSPSTSPSSTPSTTPSISPSSTPSTTPGINPSTTPSATPSVSPSSTPSATPSVSPSTTPSFTPSGSPSTTPINPTLADFDRSSDSQNGSLNSSSVSLDSVSGNSGSLVSRTTVDGENGSGTDLTGISGSLGSGSALSNIDGILGNVSNQAIVPPTDSAMGDASSHANPIESIAQTITIDGTINLSARDLAWHKLLNPGENDHLSDTDNYILTVNALSTDSYSLENDQLVFSDAENYKHSYYTEDNSGIRNAYDYNPVTSVFNFSKAELRFDVNVLSAADTATLVITYDTDKTINIDLSGLTTFAALTDKINSDLGLTSIPTGSTIDSSEHFAKSTDGFRATYYQSSEPVPLGVDLQTILIGNYNDLNFVSATLTITKSGESDTNINATIENNFSIDYINLLFKGDGQLYLPGNSNASQEYYSPDHLHSANLYNMGNTNISRFSIEGIGAEDVGPSNLSKADEHFAVSGANDSNFVSFSAGTGDTDTLSFYVPNADPLQEGSTTENADYDLVSSNAYSKIQNIEIIDAVGYGTNNIQLNKDAVVSLSEKVDGAWNLWVKGDNVDTLTLTDASQWTYNRLIDMDSYSINIWVNGDDTGIDRVTPATKTQFGNILYQYQTTNGSNTVYLNVSAEIGTHPDWYYSGTANADAIELPDTQFGSVDFADGVDTLVIHSGLASKTQDFTNQGGALSNVEIINFTNTYITSYSPDVTAVSIDAINMDKTFVAAATDANNSLSLLGDNEDYVTVTNIATEWTVLGQVLASTSGTGHLTDYNFYQYQSDNGVILNIETEVATHTDPSKTTGIYYNGWSGDDHITPFSTTYDGIDGGADTDSLGFNEANQDFTSGLGQIDNIEIIDGRTHNGDTTITLNKTAITAMTDSNNILSVIGNSSDSLNLSDANSNWNFVTSIPASTSDGSLSDFDFYQYQSLAENITLNVQSSLNHPGIFFNGDSTDNQFVSPSLSINFINAGAGTDWLLISSDDYNFTSSTTTTVAAVNSIDDLEVIDGRGDSANNIITLNQAAVVAMTDSNNKMTVFGDGGDSVALADIDSNWSWVGKVDGGLDFTGMQFYQYQSLDGSATLNIHDNIPASNRPAVHVIGDIGNSQRDDILLLENMNFSSVNGKLGTDTLVVDDSANVGSLDFSTLTSISNLEVIDISNNASGVIQSASAINISADFVYNASDADNWLLLLGDTTDSLNFSNSSNWSYAGFLDATGDWPTLHAYQATSNNNTVTLYVDTEIGNGVPVVDAKGSSGNDVIRINDKEDVNIDGQSGFDAIQTTGNTASIDLTLGKTVQGIELINLSNSQAETLHFNTASVNSADNNSLYVQGDSNDTLMADSSDGWTISGRANFDNAADMYIYQADHQGNSVSLYVQTDLLQSSLYTSPSASASDDILKVKDLNFGHLDAGSGSDRLLLLQEGNIDLANLASTNSLTNLEILDASNGVTNNLTINGDFVNHVHPSNTLYVMGDSNDNLALSGWTQGASTTVNANLTWDSYTSTASNGEVVNLYADSQINTTT